MDFEEEWVEVTEFPSYIVSNYGQIANERTGRILNQSIATGGAIKVGLVYEGKQYTRSVGLLVAEAFISGRNELFNTPIHLDGDEANNLFTNLAWRPRWFAWKYKRQFAKVPEMYTIAEVVDADTGDIYNNILDAAFRNGLLMRDILRSALTGPRVFPTDQRFIYERHQK